MALTFLDSAVIFIIIISALLAMLRGFSREIFSIISWLAAGLASYYGSGYLLPFFSEYISHKVIALGASAVTIFVITIFIVSMLTAKLTKLIVNSKIGPVDHILGLIYGGFRGAIIASLAFMFLNKLILPQNQPTWITDSISKPFLETASETITSLLPEAPADWISWIEEKVKEIDDGGKSENASPPDEVD